MQAIQSNMYSHRNSYPVSGYRTEEVRLFCFPHSGASAAMFKPWTTTLPGHISVYPVEFPGHGHRLNEGLLTHLSDLIEATTEAIVPYIDRPFAFFGHSMGALVSFELTRHLRKHYHREPVHLFVSGHNPPHLPYNDAPIHKLPDEAFLQKIRDINGTDEAFFNSPDLQAVFLPILRADFQVCETYQYQESEPLSCPITALGGLKDAHVPRSTLEAWQMHTSATFRVRMFPGDHFFLNPNRMTLLEILARELTGIPHPAAPICS